MELPFEKTVCRHWQQKLYTLVSQEETQELKLPESMPDVGTVIASWGQTILRGKDWRSSGAAISGGVLVWVLYAPEGGGPIQKVESWIPFQTRVDFPEAAEQGTLRVECVLRNLDARALSGQKLLLRAGIGLLVQAVSPAQTEIPIPGVLPEDVEQLNRTYPVELIREAGEKHFLMEEELELPAGLSEPEKLIYYRLTPEILDEKVMGSKAVFRGSGRLHLMYADRDGKLRSQDWELPFAQYVELEEEYEESASLSTLCSLTSLEVDLRPEGGLTLKAGVEAQYLVQDVLRLELLTDAYSPCREVQLQRRSIELPAWVDSREELMDLSQHFPGGSDRMIDTVFLPDLPKVTKYRDEAEMEFGGTFQAVFEKEDGSYWGKTLHDSQSAQWNTQCRTIPFSIPAGQVTSRREGSDWRVDTQVVLDLKSLCEQPMEAVCGMEAGELRQPDAQRPSVIIRRRGREQSLWELARDCGSTVEAIRHMNQMDAEPSEDQLLLIPVI